MITMSGHSGGTGGIASLETRQVRSAPDRVNERIEGSRTRRARWVEVRVRKKGKGMR